MSEAGGFSIDQLMELAGLSVSQAGSKYIHHVREFGAHKRKSTKSTLPQKAEISSLLVARATTVSFSTTAPPSFQPLLNRQLAQAATASSAPATSITTATLLPSTTPNPRNPISSPASKPNCTPCISPLQPTSLAPSPPPT